MNTHLIGIIGRVPVQSEKRLLVRSIFFLVWLGLIALPLHSSRAASYTASVNGYWTNAATWGGGGTPGNGDDAVINNAVTVTLDQATAKLNSLTNNGTLIFAGWSNTVLTATVVQVNGTITHYPNSATTTNESGQWVPDNRIQIVCTNMTIGTSGVINVDGMGFAGGNTNGGIPTPGCGPGGGPVAPIRGAGGGYGGSAGTPYGGGSGGVTYGAPDQPTWPGSGGSAGTNQSKGVGRSGGGAVLIAAAGKVTVNGMISANGATSTPYISGGSGGGIYINCQTFAGTSGVIQANGSSAPGGGDSGGGGGRIAVYFDSSSQATSPAPTVKFSTSGGGATAGQYVGNRGTIYFTDGNIFPTQVTATVPVSSGLVYGVKTWSAANLTISGAILDFRETGFQLSVNGTLVLTNSADISLRSGPTNAVSSNYGGLIDVGGDMTIGTGCVLRLYSDSTNGGSFLCRVGSLTLSTNGMIDAAGKGFAGGTTNWTGGPGGGTAAGYGAGAGYGGTGGAAGPAVGVTNGSVLGGNTYGSSNAPMEAGSGGRARGVSYAAGMEGGGVVRIEASRRVTVAGTITVNGAGTGWSGSGSGGSVFISCSRFGGSGVITAAGGVGGTSGNGGAGGGGRIAIWRCYDDPWTGAVTATNGVNADTSLFPRATPGTVVWGQLPIPGTVVKFY